MKNSLLFVFLLLGLSFGTAGVDARGLPNRSGGGGGAKRPASRPSPPARQASAPTRSPMTGSVQRSAPKADSRPASLPTKPAAKPANRPPVAPPSRPSVSKPSQQPATSGRPNNNRPTQLPAAPNRPDVSRPNAPGNKPAQLPAAPNRPDVSRPNAPGNKPAQLPAAPNRPDVSRPNAPGSRPAQLPANPNRPAGGRQDFANRPTQLPANRPGPSPIRPGANRPTTLPGMVTYPKRPGGVGGVGGVGGIGGVGGVGGINQGGRNHGLNRPSTLPANSRDWNANQWGGNRGVWGNNNQININNSSNVRINNNFKNSNNFAYQPNYWGARPWWGAGSCHSWHHGHWGYGYNRNYYGNKWYFHNNNDFARGFMWGIGVWSVGNLIYDMGYKSYQNPYPAPQVVYYPVPSAATSTTTTVINYQQPISVTAAASPPGDEKTVALAESKSDEALKLSRAAFYRGDYVSALKSCEEAIAFTPGDVTLHEYRSLALFALGRYGDAAGVLNPVLASGPGWGWDTMVAFYGNPASYSDQLRKLETYVKGTPQAADGHFLLGYHYLVCDHLPEAYTQFAEAATLQPADTISSQLANLTRSSLPESDAEPAAAPVRPAAVPGEKLVGTWVSDRGEDGKITFTMTADGNYTWNYLGGGNDTRLEGTYGLDERGLLVLTSDDTQMVCDVALKEDQNMTFELVGAPEGDPGLEFTKG